MSEYRIVIPKEQVFIQGSEKVYPQEHLMLAQLLIDEVVWFYESDGSIRLCVQCNDVFMWGCSDADDATLEDVPFIYELHMKDPDWGGAMWCILKRKEMPQKPVEDMMRKNGWVFEDYKELSKNAYDKIGLLGAIKKRLRID